MESRKMCLCVCVLIDVCVCVCVKGPPVADGRGGGQGGLKIETPHIDVAKKVRPQMTREKCAESAHSE